MRLRRIEAPRYGALVDACLGEFADRLTVVLGPNESGKTSYTALVRHVLYGYPDRRGRERTYLPPSGGRHARLVFDDTEGSWLVERSDGPHRGPVGVRALSGSERPELVAELTEGVSEATFRIVFGFGLDELAEIEQRAGDDIIARLYAAGAGLGVSPLDIRKLLDARAAHLYSSGAQKPVVNALARDIRETKARIREFEEVASAFSADQARLRELDALRAPLASQLETLDRESRQLDLDVDRLHTFHDEAVGLEPVLAEHRRTLSGLEKRLEALVPDAEVLARAPDIDVLLADLPAFRQRLATLREHGAALVELDARIAQESRGLPEAAATPDLPAAIEGWRDRLGRAEAQAEASRRAAEKAAAAARRAEEAAGTSGAPEGPGPGPATPYPALVMLALGILGAGAGLATSSTPLVAFGLVLALAGVIFLLWRPLGSARGPAATISVLAEEARRQRATAVEAADAAEIDASALETAREEWRAWLATRRLPETIAEPAGARALVDRMAERDRLVGERAHRLATVEQGRDAAQEWADKLAVLSAGLVDVPPDMDADDVDLLAARLHAVLETARATRDERSSCENEAETLRETIEAGTTRLGWLREQVAQIAKRADVTDDDPIVALEARAEQVRREVKDLAEQDDALARERHELAGKLGEEGRESAMADARQRLEGLRIRVAETADEYVALALASALLGRAQERYERDRQPEVTRRAGEVLATMTAGRYSRVQVPLGGGDIVIGSATDVRGTNELSRGTAEQLYLALRIGLVEQLGAVGRDLPVLMDDVVVNFDSERREGAARAIADLAKHRQTIFFTCHESTADLLEQVAEDCVRIPLDRCTL